MNVNQMIVALRDERDALNDAIVVLERLAHSGRKRRGRPPAWLSAAAGVSAGRPKRVFSAATKRKMALAQRKRWAAARKAKAS